MMKIEIDDKNVEEFMHLIFLGTEIINVNLAPPIYTRTQKKYNAIFEQVFALYVNYRYGEDCEKLSDEQFAKYHFEMEKSYGKYLIRYNQAIRK